MGGEGSMSLSSKSGYRVKPVEAFSGVDFVQLFQATLEMVVGQDYGDQKKYYVRIISIRRQSGYVRIEVDFSFEHEWRVIEIIFSDKAELRFQLKREFVGDRYLHSEPSVAGKFFSFKFFSGARRKKLLSFDIVAT